MPCITLTYILEGSFLFELAGITFSVGVGDFVHAPSNEPHVFQNTSDKDARMLAEVPQLSRYHLAFKRFGRLFQAIFSTTF